MPPWKRLVTKATIGETEQLFQKGEKEKKAVAEARNMILTTQGIPV